MNIREFLDGFIFHPYPLSQLNDTASLYYQKVFEEFNGKRKVKKFKKVSTGYCQTYCRFCELSAEAGLYKSHDPKYVMVSYLKEIKPCSKKLS
jgi:hypothetical protein